MRDRTPYQFTATDIATIQRVHRVVVANLPRFMEAGAKLDEDYSAAALRERARPPVPEAQRRGMLRELRRRGDSRASALELRPLREFRKRSLRFGKAVEDLFARELPVSSPLPGWDWSARVLLLVWLMCERRAEQAEIITDLQRWLWEDDSESLGRNAAAYTVPDWPALFSGIHRALASAESHGLNMSDVAASSEALVSVARPHTVSQEIRALAEEAQSAAVYFLDRVDGLMWRMSTLDTSGLRRAPPEIPPEWATCADTYARAIGAWDHLRYLLGGAQGRVLVTRLRRAYAPGTPPIKIGERNAQPTVLQAIADEVGYSLRQLLYMDRETPFDALRDNHPQLSVQQHEGAIARVVEHWRTASAEWVFGAVLMIQDWSLQPDALKVQLGREFLAAFPDDDDTTTGGLPGAAEANEAAALRAQLADMSTTQRKILRSIANATRNGTGRSLKELLHDVGVSVPSTVYEAIRALRKHGWKIPNNRNGNGYFLEGESLVLADRLLGIDT